MAEGGKERAGRDWFGVQLEITQKILEAETRKLQTLESEIADDSGDVTLLSLRRLAQKRLQMQFEQLNKEYEDAAAGLLRGKTVARMRSLPSIGLKTTQKKRSSIFGSLATKDDAESEIGEAGAIRRVSDHTTEIGLIPDAARDVVITNGRVVSGTLDALIARFTPTESFAPDKLFSFTFLIISRMFIKPHELMTRFAKSAQVLSNPDASAVLAARFAKQLGEWISTCPYDFRDERMMMPLKEITQLCCGFDQDTKTSVSEMQRVLFKKLNALEQVETKLKKEYELQLKSKTETLSGKSTEATSLMDLCPSPDIVADQLLAVEQERFTAIGPEEFVQAFVKGDKGEDEQAAQVRRAAHNIEAYVEWFNRLSYVVATEIVQKGDKKDRVKCLEFFIEVARACQARHNFNSLMAIISALNMSCIARLKKTWEKTNQKALQEYEKLEWQMDPSNNFKNYRETLDGLSSEPVIPFFSLLVKDIYFIQEATEKRLANGQINFDKMWMLSDQIAGFCFFKENLLDVKKDEATIRFLKTSPISSEAELFRVSIEAESPKKEDQDRTMERLRRMSVDTADSQSDIAQARGRLSH